ncbi:MAG: hypothetical protein SPK49_01775 [Erysipelotrichaceae bacterium]|nr:hypothetical protein [Erysipelotrichaceae bacterium]
MKKFIECGEMYFEVKKPIEKATTTTRLTSRMWLYDCYKNPSKAKESIYRYWRDYVFNTFENVTNFGVESYNNHMFTLGWTTPQGEFYVTKTRQEFYPYK